MKRILFAACLALACLAATARADTFTLLPQGLPSASAPNSDGSIGLPLNLLAAPTQPQQLDQAQLQALWQQAGSAYGIPWTVLAAINKVESNFGRNMGPSSAGAIGWMQFMPATWLRWGTDGNGDGVADPWNAQDAITSAARYLAAAGGQSDIRRAVFAYNHADWYANEVLSLAQAFSGGGAFQLDGLQQSLDQAQQAVSAASSALVDAQTPLAGLSAARDALAAKAASAQLISDKLAAQKQAVLAGVRVDEANTRIAELQRRLDEAQAALARARANAQTASFDQGAGQMLGAPAYQGQYVFPVGGGPGIVSAGHSHHDFPAVDIAAPEGAPLYALADATVINVWHTIDPACGLGLTMQAFDGQIWTYCHLSYVEPSIVDGAKLKAGDPVGLVGHTGDATGPHLHLQLQPALEWPQREAWFQQFAGVAFSWQDAAPADWPSATTRTLDVFGGPSAIAPQAKAPVFQVVPDAPAPSDGGVVLFTPQG